MAKRLANGIFSAVLLVLLPLAGALDRLAHPAPWIGFAAVVAILVSQPHIGSKEFVAKGPDEYSALVIYIAMMGSMAGAVVEYGYRSEWRPAPWSATLIAGFLLTAGSLAFRLWAIRTLGRFFTSTVQVQEGQSVVQTGPYRIVRHPSYTGALGTAYGMALALASPVGAVIVTVLAIPAYLYRIQVEEKNLVEELGDPYRAYMGSTRRLIPFVY